MGRPKCWRRRLARGQHHWSRTRRLRRLAPDASAIGTQSALIHNDVASAQRAVVAQTLLQWPLVELAIHLRDVLSVEHALAEVTRRAKCVVQGPSPGFPTSDLAPESLAERPAAQSGTSVAELPKPAQLVAGAESGHRQAILPRRTRVPRTSVSGVVDVEWKIESLTRQRPPGWWGGHWVLWSGAGADSGRLDSP